MSTGAGRLPARYEPAIRGERYGPSYRTDRQDAEPDVRYAENRPENVAPVGARASIRSEHNYAFDPILTIATVNLTQTVGY